MIDQGLAAAVLTYASVLAGIGAIVLLTFAAWRVRSPLTEKVQRRTATRGLRHTNDFPRGDAGDNDAPLRGVPHPAH